MRRNKRQREKETAQTQHTQKPFKIACHHKKTTVTFNTVTYNYITVEYSSTHINVHAMGGERKREKGKRRVSKALIQTKTSAVNTSGFHFHFQLSRQTLQTLNRLSCKLSSQPMSQHSTCLLLASYRSSSNRHRWDESSASGSHLCLRPSQSLLHTFASAPAGTTKNTCAVFLSRRTVLLTRL